MLNKLSYSVTFPTTGRTMRILVPACGRGVISFAPHVVWEGLMRGLTLITPIALAAHP
jgi:hypothetical protein